MKLKHFVVMFVAVVFAYLIIDNPPMLRDASGRESMVPDRRKLQEYLLIDALAASLVIALQLGEPLARRKLCSPATFPDGTDFDDEFDDDPDGHVPRYPLDDHLLITPSSSVKPSPYFVFNSAIQYKQPVVSPVRKLIVFGVVMALLAVGVFMFVENLSPQGASNSPRVVHE